MTHAARLLIVVARRAGTLRTSVALRRQETSLHRAANSFVPALSVAFRHAFAVARKVLKPNPLKNIDASLDALRKALSATLAPTLRKVLAAGGNVAARTLKTAGDYEGHPFRGNQWTTGSSAENYTVGDYVRVKIKDPDTGAVGKTRDLKVTAVSKLFLTGVAVNKEGDEISGKNFDEQKHIIDHRMISQHQHLELDKTYAVLKPRGGKVRGASLRTAKRTSKKTKIDFTFDAENQSAIDWADRHAAELIDGITETSREQINNAIADALETGDWKDALDEILDAVGDPERAALIARHETMLAVSEGQRQAWDQAVDEGLLDEDSVRTWITVGDGKVCPICDGLDGKTAKLGESYESDGEEYDGPPAHVSCRCTEGLSG